MRKLVLVIGISILFLRCGDTGGTGSSYSNRNVPECESKRTATVLVANTSSNPYNLYINGTFFVQIAGKTNQKATIKAGSCNLYVKQVSGYLLYPTECSTNINAISCENHSWQIP